MINRKEPSKLEKTLLVAGVCVLACISTIGLAELGKYIGRNMPRVYYKIGFYPK